MLNQSTSLLVLFLNLLFLFFYLFILTISTHQKHQIHTHIHRDTRTHRISSRQSPEFPIYISWGSLSSLLDWDSIKFFIGSFSPCFWYSCTAKMSFYCLLPLLINHVTFEFWLFVTSRTSVVIKDVTVAWVFIYHIWCCAFINSGLYDSVSALLAITLI